MALWSCGKYNPEVQKSQVSVYIAKRQKGDDKKGKGVCVGAVDEGERPRR